MDAFITGVRDSVVHQLRPMVRNLAARGRLSDKALDLIEAEARRLVPIVSEGVLEVTGFSRGPLVSLGQLNLTCRRVSSQDNAP